MTSRSRVDALVATLPSAALVDLAAHPARAISDHFGLRVQRARHVRPRGAGGLCDGVSFTGDGLVLYVPGPGRRSNFTLVHELGHHVIDTAPDPDLFDWIQDQQNPQRALEQACDVFAAAILLSRDLVDGVVDVGPARARHVADLYENSGASRHACLIALGRKLSCEGFLASVNVDDMTVFASCRTGETRPYGWKGDSIPAAHPIRDLADGRERSAEAHWPYPSGTTRRYYFNAYRDGDWIYIIHAEANLWGSSPLSIEDPGQQRSDYSAEVNCPDCGFSGITGQFPCPICKASFCPDCKRCDCDRRVAREERCASCTVMVRADLLDDGLCPACR